MILKIFLMASFGLFTIHAKATKNSLGMTLVPVKPGTFIMGSPPTEKGHQDDEKQREITRTQSFSITATEITQKQWMTLMGTSFEDLVNKQRGPLGRGAKLSSIPSATGNNQPMCFVNWQDAIDFCKALTKKERDAGLLSPTKKYTLPTEAQWEYACRAGTISVFGTGNTLTSKDANFYGKLPYGVSESGEYRKKTTQVATFPANPWGIFDMHGNVYEWCFDWYEASPISTKDPTGPAQGDGRIIRGGAWDRKSTSCRAAYRYSRDPNRRAHNIGFRIVIVSL